MSQSDPIEELSDERRKAAAALPDRAQNIRGKATA